VVLDFNPVPAHFEANSVISNIFEVVAKKVAFPIKSFMFKL